MVDYETFVRDELLQWQRKMLGRPGFFNNLSKKLQIKINSYIPEKVHAAITSALKQLIRGILFGAKVTTFFERPAESLQLIEIAVKNKIKFYQSTAAVEGGITGAGGILLGFVDFPVLIGIKMKMLYEIAALYGFDLTDYKERVYLLHIFELAFSSDVHRRNVYLQMLDWDENKKLLPEDINQFDWRSLQQEYRDFLDLAKMAQLIPVIGAPVGIVVNYRLVNKLGTTAINAYRMRKLSHLLDDKNFLEQ
ncbi:hypothetical protein ACVWYG_002514 [Pedobacter sp. UYEF25]